MVVSEEHTRKMHKLQVLSPKWVNSDPTSWMLSYDDDGENKVLKKILWLDMNKTSILLPKGV
jgi:hypothetical protein